jgi:Ca2+:H+ antiporter
VARRLLWASLVLAPVAILLRFATGVGDVTLFVAAAAALVPLAWLIGEATEHTAEHTGPGVGGFLNATFGNAPELIIALFAVSDGLPEVVRGSLAGSIVSNLLLVLGVSVVVGAERLLDSRSLLEQLALVLAACFLLLIPSIPGWSGDPDRHSLTVLSIPVACLLLALYVAATPLSLRRHRRQHQEAEATEAGGWSLRTALVALAVATVVTAVVSEVLVSSLEAFGEAAHLSEFFIAAVIVAIVGNAAEHGGAVVVARRGKMRLASEIAVSSATQVALLILPAVALLSWLVKPSLALTFRPVELTTMAAAAVVVALVVRDARGTRREGMIMLAAYALMVLAYWVSGDR